MMTLRFSPVRTLFFAVVLAPSGCSDDDAQGDEGSSTSSTSSTTLDPSSTSTTVDPSSTTDVSSTTTGDTSSESTTETGEPLLELGESCLGSDECESGHCYQVGGMGVCSECRTDADCEDGGCSPPNILVSPFAPGFCNSGELGEACSSDETCVDDRQCIEVVGVPEFELSTCSECATDADCDDGESCTPHYDLERYAGYFSCAELGTVPTGGGCTPGNDEQCESGMCGEVSVFFGALTLGVCGDCKTNDDCETEGEECLPASIDESSQIVAPTCGVPAPQD